MSVYGFIQTCLTTGLHGSKERTFYSFVFSVGRTLISTSAVPQRRTLQHGINLKKKRKKRKKKKKEKKRKKKKKEKRKKKNTQSLSEVWLGQFLHKGVF